MRLKSFKTETIADDIPLKIIAFIVQDESRLELLLAQTGLQKDDLLRGASEPAFQAMIVDHLLENESAVLEFAANHELSPDAVLRARSKLPGFSV